MNTTDLQGFKAVKKLLELKRDPEAFVKEMQENYTDYFVRISLAADSNSHINTMGVDCDVF